MSDDILFAGEEIRVREMRFEALRIGRRQCNN